MAVNFTLSHDSSLRATITSFICGRSDILRCRSRMRFSSSLRDGVKRNIILDAK